MRFRSLPAQFAHYHDHWLALMALSVGDIAFVDRPLYDYVQHGSATLGHAAANRMATLRERLAARRSGRRERVRMWRMHYFVDACRLLTLVSILERRGGPRISPAKRRVLRRFQGAERSLPALALLWFRGVRELLGRRETLGAEWVLFRAFMWRRMLTETARERPQQRFRLDAVPPADLAPRTSYAGSEAPGAPSIAAKIAPLDLAPAERAPERLNLLIPTIDLAHFFGGYIAKFNLARRLAERGARVRIVTVDPVPPLPRGWRRQVEAYSELAGLFDRVELAFGRGGGPLEVSPRDRFIATTWWTAHIASEAGRALEIERFAYLIQEYEPFTFPMGTYAALAEQSYRFQHFALFSTELLRGYFRAHGIGVYAVWGAPRETMPRPHSRTRSPMFPGRARRIWRGVRPGGCCSTGGPSRTRPGTCTSWACSVSLAPSKMGCSDRIGSSTVSARSPDAAGSDFPRARC